MSVSQNVIRYAKLALGIITGVSVSATLSALKHKLLRNALRASMLTKNSANANALIIALDSRIKY